MEENHIVHRDVAASNVLIADDNTAKVADFGLAKFVETTGKENGNKDSNENIITPEKIKCRTKWTAPEALESKVNKIVSINKIVQNISTFVFFVHLEIYT